MPGIVGIIEKETSNDSAITLKAMAISMAKEDFQTSGIYVDAKLKLCLGWVCHKGSFSDCLPIWNEKKDVCLVFVGEDAKNETEVAGIRARGHECSTNNAEYLVHLYEEEGPEFLEKINGGFSGILIDFRQERILLFNDRYGLNRLYYHENDKGFYFSSEAKSLLKVFPDLRRLDYSSLGEFFSCGCVIENKTLFSGIMLLPGGSLWKFAPGGGIEKATYFSRDTWENQAVLGEALYYEKLKETWPRVLPRYFPKKEKLTVSLSGGIGSQMIMAWAPCPPYRVPCYTISSAYRESVDVKNARRIARLCQQHHETIKVRRNFISEFPALAKKAVLYTDGTMDVSGAIDLYVNRIVREIAPIRVTGYFGGQILRRNIGFKMPSFSGQVFDGDFIPRVQDGMTSHISLSSKIGLSFLAFHQIPWYDYPRLALGNVHLTSRLPFLDNDLLSLAYRAQSESIRNVKLLSRLISEGFPALGRLSTGSGITHKLFPVVATMRRPLLEYGNQENNGQFQNWYRGALANYVKDVLLDPRTLGRSYLNKTGIESIVNKHIMGQGNYTREIHMLLSSELIQRHLIRSAEP